MLKDTIQELTDSKNGISFEKRLYPKACPKITILIAIALISSIQDNRATLQLSFYLSCLENFFFIIKSNCLFNPNLQRIFQHVLL